jgi:hypothetical protein
MHFATVVSADAPAADRAAMLAVLEAHVKDHNAQSRWQEQRAAKGPFFDEEMNISWRRWVLHRWELQGDPSGWPAQLEALYQKQPVFMLLGGLVKWNWAPIHRFCEARQLPCLLPFTDHPVVSDQDWYTLYFSKGLTQEGMTAARYLQELEGIPPGTPVVQLYRRGTAGERLAASMGEAREKAGRFPEIDTIDFYGTALGAEFWVDFARDHPNAILALWLEPADLAGMDALGKLAAGRPRAIFLSSTLLQNQWQRVPESLRDRVFITWPWALPEESRVKQLGVQQWMKVRGIAYDRPAVQGPMYFLGWILSDLFMHMRRNFYRDYALDLMDMMRDQTFAVPVYPRLSFGPGQRYAAKGCYIVQLGVGPEPTLIRKSDWVIY